MKRGWFRRWFYGPSRREQLEASLLEAAKKFRDDFEAGRVNDPPPPAEPSDPIIRYQKLQGELEAIDTDVLIFEASRLGLPTPQRPWNDKAARSGPDWKWVEVIGRANLTDIGVFELRRRIRTEREAIWKLTGQKIIAWTGLVSAIGGALAVVLGLVALLSKRG